MTTPELSRSTREYLKFGELCDSLGLNGDAPSFDDHLDFLIAVKEMLEIEGLEAEPQQVIIDSLDQLHYEMRHTEISTGAISAYLLGAVVGIVTMHPGAATAHNSDKTTHLIDRSVQNVRVARQRAHFGNESYFNGGYLKAHGILSDMGLNDKPVHLARYVEKAVSRSIMSEPKKPSRFRKVLLGLFDQNTHLLAMSNPSWPIIEYEMRRAEIEEEERRKQEGGEGTL